MKVYVGASKGISLGSKLIKYWQFGFPYTHIFYILGDPVDNDPLIIEAWHQPILKGGRVCLCNLSENHSKGTLYSVFSIEVTENQKKNIESFLKDQIGKKYDFIGLLAFPFRMKKLAKNKRWFCSELVFEAFLRAGVELLQYTDSHEVSPALFLKSPLLKFEFQNILE